MDLAWAMNDYGFVLGIPYTLVVLPLFAIFAGALRAPFDEFFLRIEKYGNNIVEVYTDKKIASIDVCNYH